MPSASAIRTQIESSLAERIPSALTPVQRIFRPVAPTGVAALDELLQGGLPLGAITELTGPESSGRTSVALSYIAGLTRAGRVCAWIDAGNALHAESAAAAGVDLARLLWVRCGVQSATRPIPADASFSLPRKYMAAPPVKRGLHGGGFGNHPRNETQGISKAVGDLLRPQNFDPRYDRPAPFRWPLQKSSQPVLNSSALSQSKRRAGKPWTRMEQALKATDLLLQDGGFSAIVLDIADGAPEHVSRVELSIWFRYRAAVARTQASLLLLTQHACAKSAGELLLRFEAGIPCDEETVFTGLEHRVQVARRRFSQESNVIPLKKPSQSERIARWRGTCTWAGTR